MVESSAIRQHMAVVGSDGAAVGTVDHVDGSRIKLARSTAADGVHHYISLSSVARVDDQVHLSITAAAALTGFAAEAGDANAGQLPPLRNPAVEGSQPRRNYYLPWLLAAVALIALLLLFRSCTRHEAAERVAPPAGPATAALPVESVTLPGGTKLELAPATLNYALQRYLAGSEPTPRTFAFDHLNFDTGAAAIRDEDAPTIKALAQILAAYPNAKVKLVGYADARGSDPANAQLGQQRASAVLDRLVGEGVDRARVEAASGGEANPVGSNATAGGQFENRRTELTVLAK